MPQIDDRLIEVGFTINGQLVTFKDLFITASGTKYANANQNECEVQIANLDTDTRNYLITATSPFNPNNTPVTFYLSAGRKSTGLSQIYVGNIASSEISQPPDLKLTLKTVTGHDKRVKITVMTQPGNAKLSEITKQTAANLGVKSNFQATDKNISNYSYSGGSLDQVSALGSTGSVDAYIDDETLVVKDSNLPVRGEIINLSEDTGMIGIPQIIEQGIQVTYLLDNKTQLGSLISLTSLLNPGINGQYIIYKLGFNIATRERPFYWIAEAKYRQQ